MKAYRDTSWVRHDIGERSQVRLMSDSRSGRLGVVLAVLLSLGGLAVSAILLQHHVIVEVGGDPLLNAVCEAGEHTSCDEVLASAWGSFTWQRDGRAVSVPTAMFGFVFFAAMASWFIVIGRPAGTRRWLYVLPLLAVTAATAVCAFLDYVMFFQLASWCPFCLASHVLTGLLLIVTLLLWPRRRRTETDAELRAEMPYPAHPSLRLVWVAVLLTFAISMAGWNEYQRRLARAYADEFLSRWQAYEGDYRKAHEKLLARTPRDIPIEPDDPVRGRANAPHTVVVFTDFQCPFCRVLSMTLDERLAEFPGHFRIVFKHFPMNTRCNEHVRRTLHGASCAAAVTAEAARIVGGNEAFWEMHDALFADPDGFARLPKEFVKSVCDRIGVDNDALWRRINTHAVWEHIKANAAQGHALGLDATPSLFFDGRKMDKWGDEHTWRYLLGLVDDEGKPVWRDPVPTTATSAPATRPATQPTRPAA